MQPIGHPSDQVPRKMAYEAGHPDTHILYCGSFWQAITTEPNGVTVVTRYELADLLDKLETL